MDTISLVLPSKPQYVTTLRLVTASVAQMLHFDIEAVEDLRVCISESVNYLLPYNEELKVRFDASDEELRIIIAANYEEAESDDQELHRMILESLMTEVDYREGNITLVKKLS